MAALNFPDPAFTQTYTEAGITWTWNATLGVWSSDDNDGFTETDADQRYLRIDAGAPDQTRVSGKATFAELTTHEAGVSVTGGDVANGPGLYTTSNGNVNVSNNAGERVASFASSGRIGFPASTGAAGVYISNTPSTSANLSYGIWLDPDWSDASGTTAYGINASAYDGPGTLNTFAGYRASGTTDTTKFASSDSIQAGFLAKNTISGAAEINAGFYSELTSISDKNYNFYAEGTAPNYFKGGVQFANAGGNAGTTVNGDTLNRYEEGSWTAVIGGDGTINGVTPSDISSTYRVIGALVHVRLRIDIPNTNEINLNNSVFSVTGMPFNAENYSQCVGCFGDGATNKGIVIVNTRNDIMRMKLVTQGDGTGSVSWISTDMTYTIG